MHGRPDIVHFQPKQQLENLLVGFCADGVLPHITLHPVLQLLLVVDKNPPVFHNGTVRPCKSVGEKDFLLPAHRHVPEKVPGRHSQIPFANLINPVHRPPPVAACNQKLAVLFLYQKGFFVWEPLLVRQKANFRFPADFLRHAKRSRYDSAKGNIARGLRTAVQHPPQIPYQIPGRPCHRLRFPGFIIYLYIIVPADFYAHFSDSFLSDCPCFFTPRSGTVPASSPRIS